MPHELPRDVGGDLGEPVEREASRGVRGEDDGDGRRDPGHPDDEQARQSLDAPRAALGGEHGGPPLVDVPEARDLERPAMGDERLEPLERQVGRHLDHERPTVAAQALGHGVVDRHRMHLQLAVVPRERRRLPCREQGEAPQAGVARAAPECVGRVVRQDREAVEVELAPMVGEEPGGVEMADRATADAEMRCVHRVPSGASEGRARGLLPRLRPRARTPLESFVGRRRPPFGSRAPSDAHPPGPSPGQVATLAFARLARAAAGVAQIETDALPTTKSTPAPPAGSPARPREPCQSGRRAVGIPHPPPGGAQPPPLVS